MSVTRAQLDDYMASKSDSWLQVELKQAAATANDSSQTHEFRESALAAGCLMAIETQRRKKQ
jgi:hypothetical protein